MAEIDNLELKITSDSTSAVNGLDRLADTLDKLKSYTKGGLGLTSVANQVSKIAKASGEIDGTKIANLKGFAEAIKTLSGVGDIKISSTIAKQLTAINTALGSLNIGSGNAKIQELVSALQPLETLGKSSLSTTVNALKKLPEALQKIDTQKLYGQISALTRIMKPLADEMQKVANGFNAFPSRIQKLIQENEKLSSSNNKTSLSYTNLYHKLKMAYTAIKSIAKGIAKVIKLSNDYVEDLNLFNASMGQYATEAQKYAEQVGEIMGIDPGEWMRSQGVFMTLATGFGVVSDRAYKMSKNLTQLGYDLSSFFNISTEDAMLKLQSGLAGELEPLRRIGFDLSQTRLQQEAYTLGITKKISAMTQAEKAELRYHAILTQVTTAHGDMARTINAPANQLRILKAQVTQAGRAIGNIFIPALNAILPVAIAVVKVVRLVAESIANFFGYELPEVDYSSLDGIASGANAISEGLDNATESAKKLQQYTMGFDELNVINPDSGSNNDASGIGNGSGFDFELPKYDFLKNITESNVDKIFEKMKSRLGEILITVGLVGTGLLSWKIATSLFTSLDKLLKLLKNPTLTKPMSITGGVILSVVGLGLEFTGVKSAIENGLDGLNFSEIVNGGGALIAGASMLGKAFGSTVVGASVGAIIAGVPMFFTGLYDACKNGLDWLNGVLIPLGSTITGAGIGAIIGMLGGPIGAGIGALIGLAVGALTDLVIAVVQNWGTIAEWFNTNVTTPVCNYFKGLWDNISGFFTNLWKDITSVWSGVSEWFNNKVITPVSTLFSSVTDWIGTFFEGCWIIVQAVWVIASNWFDVNVITPIQTAWETATTAIGNFFTNLWEDIKSVWNTASNWFNTNVITPVKNLFETLWNNIKTVWGVASKWFNDTVITPVREAWKTATTKIGEFFTALWDGIKTGVVSAMNAVIGGIESAINWITKGINRLISGFNDLVTAAAEVVGADWSGLATIPEVTLTKITKLETGGFPDTGQMFIAREAGAELVGNIGRKTAVVNNEQIVASVSRGVAEANNESNSLLREQNSLLRALLEKETGVYLDGKRLTNSVEKYQSQRGRQLVVGGAL